VAAAMSTMRWTLLGWGTAALMLVIIAILSLSGEWPIDSTLERAETHGILAQPRDRVARIEIAEGGRTDQFVPMPSGAWLRNGTPVDAAIAGHLDAALRLLTRSAPDRVFNRGDYDDRQMGAFGLDPPQAQITIIAHDGAATRVAFGDATPTQVAQYVRILGRPEVYLLSRFVGTEWQLALDMANRASDGSASVNAGDARAPSLFSPVSIARIWAVELVAGGRMIRFERDSAGNWFHHAGEHVHTLGGVLHRADPAMAPLIAAELAGIDQARVETVVAHKPEDSAMQAFGLQHPSDIVLLYSQDSSRPVARLEIGEATKDGHALYARARGSDTVVTIPSLEASHLNRLIELAGNTS